MDQIILTEDEIVNTLQRSTLTTVLVEGPSDQIIYRWLEDRLDPLLANVLPCGGREMLFAVFRRREEFQNLNTVFVADRDMLLYADIPEEFEDIIWTSGYSIENDLYADSKLNDLMSPPEQTEFDTVLAEIIRWFAFEVEEFRAGREAQVAHHASRVVPPKSQSLCKEFCRERGFTEPSAATVREVSKSFALNVRGKVIFDVLLRLLNRPGRVARYSRNSLLEVGLKTSKKKRYLNKIAGALTERLDLS